jgi:hypothetical protein
MLTYAGGDPEGASEELAGQLAAAAGRRASRELAKASRTLCRAGVTYADVC